MARAQKDMIMRPDAMAMGGLGGMAMFFVVMPMGMIVVMSVGVPVSGVFVRHDATITSVRAKRNGCRTAEGTGEGLQLCQPGGGPCI